MESSFLEKLFLKQLATEAVPPNKTIAAWANNLICLLFPEKSECKYANPDGFQKAFEKLQEELTEILKNTHACECCDIPAIADAFFKEIPGLFDSLNKDLEAILDGDPAAHSAFEVIRAYPGFLAICYYRIAHSLHIKGIPFIPRILTEHAHSLTGIDIHPAATIGTHFFIDHGTGIVIGETSTIGNHVKIYQGVTLGALSVEKDMANQKRHPTVGDHVVIYSNATILGGDTWIGKGSIIGGNVWITKSIPEGSKVYFKGETQWLATALETE